MVDLNLLRERGVSSEAWKPLFEAEKKDPALDKLIKRIRSRVQDGIGFNMQHWRLYYGIDEAWDAPLRALTPTLTRALAARGPVEAEAVDSVLQIAKALKMSHLIREETDPKTGKKLHTMPLPTFFEVVFSLVRAYVVIRWAKLLNDRNLDPFFKYTPVKSTPLNRVRCDIVTDRVEVVSTQYGYLEYLKQAILRSLLYGWCLMFVQEEWHTEYHWSADGGEGGDAKKKVVKEGLRYHLPHPSRTYYDLAHPLSSLNTDTGVEFMGYWRVVRYKDVRENPTFWNLERIGISTKDWVREYPAYFSTAYLGGCTMTFPQTWAEQNANMREYNWYVSDLDDTAITLTEHFEKIIPSDCGLGDYDCPIWVRFVVASDNSVLYAAPLPGPGAVFFGSDNDEGRAINSSLALEIIPFQDQIGNLFTQALLSAKQNLTNLSLLNSDIIGEEEVKKLENIGERLWRKINFVRYSGRKMRAEKNDVREAVSSIKFPQADVASLVNCVDRMIGMLERVIQTSAQEVGSYASHEQSAEEIRLSRASTSGRVQFAGVAIDRGCDAWKRQVYNYLMAYGEEEVYAQIPANIPLTTEKLNELGFTVEEHAENMAGKHLIKTKKSALQSEYFVSTREFGDRPQNADMANAMAQFLGSVFSNPILMQSIGPEQAIHLMNQVLETMGLPRDFKLNFMTAAQGGPVDQAMLQKVIGEFSNQVKQAITQGDQNTLKQAEVAMKQIVDELTHMHGQVQHNTVAIEKVTELLEHISPAAVPQLSTPPAPATNGPVIPAPMAGQAPVGGPALVGQP